MQICSIFALLPYLSTSLPTQFHQLGYLKGEDGRIYEAILVDPQMMSDVRSAEPQNPLPLMDPYGDGAQFPENQYPGLERMDMEARRMPRSSKSIKSKKEGKKEYDAWILSNLG